MDRLNALHGLIRVSFEPGAELLPHGLQGGRNEAGGVGRDG